MMGSGGRGVSICPATWRALRPAGSGLSARSPRPSSPQERRDIRPSQAETGTSTVMRRPSPALRPACPSGTRCRRPTCGAGSPPACGRPRRARVPCPGAWRWPCPRPASADHLPLRMSREWAASYSAVRASSSPHRLMPALHVGLAGLIASWREAEMGADVARLSEAVRAGRSWRGTPSAVSGPTPGTVISRRHVDSSLYLVEHTLGQPLDFPGHHLDDTQRSDSARLASTGSSAANSRTRRRESPSGLACRPSARPRATAPVCRSRRRVAC